MFSTIYTCMDYNKNLSQKIFNDLFSKTPQEPGVFYIIGTFKDNFRPVTLYLGMTNNLIGEISSVVSEWTKKDFLKRFRIDSISYKTIYDKVKASIIFINLFKVLKPELNYEVIVSKQIRDEQLSDEQIEFNEESYKRLYELYFKNIKLEQSEFKKFNLTEYKYISNESGIYFLYNSDEQLLYIGKSINLQQRLYEHLNGSTNTKYIKDNFKLFKVFYIDESYLATYNTSLDAYESYLINTLKPLLNVDKVHTYRTQRYDVKYNKKIQKFGSLENLIKFKYALQDAKKSIIDIENYFSSLET